MTSYYGGHAVEQGMLLVRDHAYYEHARLNVLVCATLFQTLLLFSRSWGGVRLGVGGIESCRSFLHLLCVGIPWIQECQNRSCALGTWMVRARDGRAAH